MTKNESLLNMTTKIMKNKPFSRSKKGTSSFEERREERREE
jgi:hypothetical protein